MGPAQSVEMTTSHNIAPATSAESLASAVKGRGESEASSDGGTSDPVSDAAREPATPAEVSNGAARPTFSSPTFSGGGIDDSFYSAAPDDRPGQSTRLDDVPLALGPAERSCSVCIDVEKEALSRARLAQALEAELAAERTWSGRMMLNAAGRRGSDLSGKLPSSNPDPPSAAGEALLLDRGKRQPVSYAEATAAEWRMRSTDVRGAAMPGADSSRGRSARRGRRARKRGGSERSDGDMICTWGDPGTGDTDTSSAGSLGWPAAGDLGDFHSGENESGSNSERILAPTSTLVEPTPTPVAHQGQVDDPLPLTIVTGVDISSSSGRSSRRSSLGSDITADEAEESPSHEDDFLDGEHFEGGLVEDDEVVIPHPVEMEVGDSSEPIKLRPKTALNEEMICGWVSENGSGSIGSTADDPDLSASDDEAETGGRVYFTDWRNRVSSSDNLVAIAEEAQLSDTGSSDGVDDVSGDEEGGEVGLDSFELGRIVRDIETMVLHGLSDNSSASPPTLNRESEADGINFKARQAPETALSQKPLTYGSKGASLSSNFADEEVLKINGPTEENLSEVTPRSIPDRGKKAKTNGENSEVEKDTDDDHRPTDLAPIQECGESQSSLSIITSKIYDSDLSQTSKSAVVQRRYSLGSASRRSSLDSSGRRERRGSLGSDSIRSSLDMSERRQSLGLVDLRGISEEKEENQGRFDKANKSGAAPPSSSISFQRRSSAPQMRSSSFSRLGSMDTTISALSLSFAPEGGPRGILSESSSRRWSIGGSTTTSVSNNSSVGNSGKTAGRRGRVHVNVDVMEYKKKVVPKTDKVKQVIRSAIASNPLFATCSGEELSDLIDVFQPRNVISGTVIIKEGDKGDEFYVMEKGTVNVFVGDTNVCALSAGSGFGEVALLYGCPRSATLRAKHDCKLWSIDRHSFRAITGQYKRKRMKIKIEFLKRVKLKDKVLGDVLSTETITAMASATRADIFQKGEIIIKKGESGDIFYMIEKGFVDVFINEEAEEPVATLCSGQFFGETALLSDVVRSATCVAKTDVVCLVLMRDDFAQTLGNLEELIRDANGRASQSNNNEADLVVEPIPFSEDPSAGIDLKCFDVRQTIGVGAFGSVKLVKAKGKVLDEVGKSNGYYALRCISKELVEENDMANNILSEKTIMGQLKHPFILRFIAAIQDSQNFYFLTEALLGGGLYELLQSRQKLPEAWTQFYSASVVDAFCHMHSRKIAYRDLKPENVLLDQRGYAKIVDFGLAKKIKDGQTWTWCGTPDYLAPEMLLNEGHDWAVDYWALGVFLVEMSSGEAPFADEDPMEIYQKILGGHINMPTTFSANLQDLVKKLLHHTPSKRLGRTVGGGDAVLKHNWYDVVDCDAIIDQRVAAPHFPPTFTGNEVCSDDAERDSTQNYKNEKDPHAPLRRRLTKRPSYSLGQGNRHQTELAAMLKAQTFLLRIKKRSQPKSPEKTIDAGPVENSVDEVNTSISGSIPIESVNRSMSMPRQSSNRSMSMARQSSDRSMSMARQSSDRSMSMARQSSDRSISKIMLALSESKDVRDVELPQMKRSSLSTLSIANNMEYEFDELKVSERRHSISALESAKGKSLISHDDDDDDLARRAEEFFKTQKGTFLKAQLMHLALSAKEREGQDAVSFDQFSLLSATPETLAESYSGGHEEEIGIEGTTYLDPFSVQAVEVVDQYPNDATSANDDALEPEALSAFCFPNGMKVRLVPRAAMAGDAQLGFIGKERDQYQLHGFTNVSGDMSHGIAITVWDELDDCIDTDRFKSLLQMRRRIRQNVKRIARVWKRYVRRRVEAATLISRSWKMYQANKISYLVGIADGGHERFNKVTKLHKIRLWGQKEKTPKKKQSLRFETAVMRNINKSTVAADNKMEISDDSHYQRNFSRKEKEKKYSAAARRLAIEAYEYMLDSDSLGEACLVQNCYVLIGTKPEEQSLLFRALQQIVDLEREDSVDNHRPILTSAGTASGSTKIQVARSNLGQSNGNGQSELDHHQSQSGTKRHSFHIENRHSIMKILQKKARLSAKQARVVLPRNTLLAKNVSSKPTFQLNMPIGRFEQIELSLPLPQVSGEWGFAQLLLRLSAPDLILLLKLILMERSLVIVGLHSDEVTACGFALLELLDPFKWASAFMPVLPMDLMDFVSSPVPFIAGIVVNEIEQLRIVEEDERIMDAMLEGLSVLNLTSATLITTVEDGIEEMLQRGATPTTQLTFYQSRFEQLAAKESSALHSLKDFFNKGPTAAESLTLQSMRLSIKSHLQSFAGPLSYEPETWRLYGDYSSSTGTFEFSPDKVLQPLKDQMIFQLQFQEMMFHTQLFVGYVEKMKDYCENQDELLGGKSAKLIASWLSSCLWKRKQAAALS